MSPEGRKRISVGILVGVVTASVVALIAIAVREGRPDRAIEAARGLVFMTPIIWLIFVGAALIASRLTREVTLPHVAVWSVAVYIGVIIFALSISMHGGVSREITGEPCNGGKGRKVAMLAENARPGGPTYWSCVSLSEYQEMQQSGSLPPSTKRDAIPFERLIHAIINRQVLTKGLLLGCIAAVAGWLYTFGWRWWARLDDL